MKNVYAIHAKKRCGKDTVAQMIADEFQGALIYSLADPIKASLEVGMREVGCYDHVCEELGVSVVNGLLFDATGDKDHREETVELFSEDVRCIFEHAITVLCDTFKYLIHYKSLYLARNEEMFENNTDHVWSIRRMMTSFGTDLCVRVHRETWIQIFYNEIYCSPSVTDIIVPDIRQKFELDFMRYINAKMIFVYRSGYSNVKVEHSTERGLQPDAHDIIIRNNSTLEDLRKTVYGEILL